jgi:hypothetical protein
MTHATPLTFDGMGHYSNDSDSILRDLGVI